MGKEKVETSPQLQRLPSGPSEPENRARDVAATDGHLGKMMMTVEIVIVTKIKKSVDDHSSVGDHRVVDADADAEAETPDGVKIRKGEGIKRRSVDITRMIETSLSDKSPRCFLAFVKMITKK